MSSHRLMHGMYSFVVVVITDASPFHRRRRPRPVCDHFVRDGSAPPALALAVFVTNDRRFGRVVDDDNNGLPTQSISNINRVMTSSLCSLSLLVSVVFIVVLLLPKRPSKSRRRTTSNSKKSHAHPPASALVSTSSSVVMPLPPLPSQCSRPKNNTPMSLSPSPSPPLPLQSPPRYRRES